MLNASFSQGAEDIKAVLDWLHLNPKLKASSVILVSFSLSALDARLMLRDEVCRRQISYWISCMGTPEFRHLMIKVNCGLDFLEHYQLGIKLGVMPVLGNLVNVDPYVADGVANAVATLDQARDDMRHIDIPITWIYGEHDHWVKPEFIRDIMSVHSNAPRDVLSVPIGHNARTSEEALRLFGTITSLIHRFLYKEMISPIIPDKHDLDLLRRAEKDRIPARNLKDRKEYWHRYLIGEENLLGFDVMALSDDYRQLMQDQMLAFELNQDDCLLDLGGGTGNFIEHILANNQNLPRHMTIADLVPEALGKALKKLAKHSDRLKRRFKLDALSCDIEMNRYLPVQRFLDGEIGRFWDLVDKVENLTLQSAEKIEQAYSPRLHRVLRGGDITVDLKGWLKGQFELPEYRTIIDFNRAARYFQGWEKEKPMFRKLVFSDSLEANFHLPFKPGYYNKILMSLVLSYIFNPVETLIELRHILRPGGLLVLSSMRPDADASGLFTRLVDKIEAMPIEELPPEWPKQLLLESLRSFLNDAQALVELEEAGTFDFFDPEKLESLLEEAGWKSVRTIPSFGDPPQGYVVVAKVRETNG
jgi:ubiquinone/menaquinone biosynthesis C-methylase UbiE